MKLRELTQEERDYATQHHHLVDDFLRSRKLDDDHYDIVIFGYLKAVQRYLADSCLQAAYPFKAIAFRLMKDAFLEDLRYLNRQKRKAYVQSLDCPVCEDGEPLINLIPNTAVDSTVAVTLAMLEEIDIHLTERQREVLRLRLEGYSCKEIAKMTNRATNTIYIDFVNMRAQLPARCVL